MADYQINQNVTGAGNFVVGVGDIHIGYRLDAEAARNRQILDDLLDKVERFWIRSILDPLTASRSWLELSEESQNGLIGNPLAQTLDMEQATGRGYQPSDPNADISDIYLGVGRTLLILGEPGAGKTIALLKLAKTLIARARGDPRQLEPIPVVLPLGGWNARSQTLLDWAAGQLAELYFVSDGTRLIQERRLALLLDGLDEVADDQQGRCARAINQFNRTVGSPGMAVCSRLQDYRNLIAADPESRLRLYGAVSIQALADAQIERYLEGLGAGLAPLRQALGRSPDLRALARTPLMLNVMAVAFEAREDDPRPDATAIEEPTLAWLFDAYIERMLGRARNRNGLPNRDRMFAWLGWLARRMRAQHQPLLLLERLQPSWLERRSDRWLYVELSRMLAGAAFGLIIALTEWLGTPVQAAGIEVQPGELALGALLGTGAGFVMGLIDALVMRDRGGNPRLGWVRLIQALALGALYAPLWGTAAWLLTADAGAKTAWGEAIGWGILGGAFFATRNGLCLGMDIRLPELLRWSWTGLGRGLVKGAAIGAVLAAATTLLSQPADLLDSGPYATAMLATGALIGCTVGALFGAFRGETLPQQVAPNQGVRETLKGSLLVFAITAAALGLLTGGATAALYHGLYGLWLGLLVGLTIGLAAALWYGGLALIRHFTLRGVLALRGYTPLRYVSFLNHACDLIFLRRIGGGYQFAHDLLRQHLANRG